MRIYLVSLHGCIKGLKVGWSLSQQGIEVHHSSSHLSPTHSWNLFDSVSLWNAFNPDGTTDTVQLAKSVQTYSKFVDIFHVQNEPNWIFKVVRENTDKPVVWDIHDWSSIRTEQNPYEIEAEKYALANANGFIVPSKGYLKRIRGISTKPSVLIYSKVPAALFPASPVQTMPGLCYEGGLKGKNEECEYNYPYRNWASFTQEAVKHLPEGNEIYLYSANTGEDFADYAHEKIKIADPLMYNILLDGLGRHTAGLVGSPYPLPDFLDSMPNKLFEYTAAGIPSIVINSPEALEYVEQHGLGVGINDPSEVGEALEKLKNNSVVRDRWSFTMETETTKLVEFYKEIVAQCTPRRRVIRQMGS